MNGVQPFQFQSMYPPGQEPVDLEDESESGDTNQRDSPSWHWDVRTVVMAIL